MMVTTIATWLISRKPGMTLGHAQRLAKIGTIAAAVIVVVAGFLIWDHFDDKAAIERANLERQAEQAEMALEAERRANEGDQTRREAREQSSADTQEVMDNAERKDPEGAAAPAGPVSRAAAGRLPRSD